MTLSPYHGLDRRFHSSQNSAINSVLIMVLIFLGVQFYRQAWPFQICNHHHETIDDETEPVSPSNDDLLESYLVVVEESKSRPVERVKILNNYQFWFGLRDRGLKGFRILDPDSSDAKSFVEEAASASIQPPFVMHIAADGKVLSTIPFPNQVALIEEMLK